MRTSCVTMKFSVVWFMFVWFLLFHFTLISFHFIFMYSRWSNTV